jgi:predicted lipid-binding transport protein (Tim44 family)
LATARRVAAATSSRPGTTQWDETIDRSVGAHFETKRYRAYVEGRHGDPRPDSRHDNLEGHSLTAIVILALVALFIGLRLYAVLGERTGHEAPIMKPAEADKRVDAPAAAAPLNGPATAPADMGDLAYLPTAGPGVRALLAADPAFDVARFLEGAKAAYRMILESYWKGDLDAMRPHVDDHVYETFAGAVRDRESSGLKLDNRLVAIEQAVIAGAEVDKIEALVTVRFETDIAAVTRNAEGEVVAGSLTDAVQTRDLWTFRRSLASADPNWLLVETDDEE